MAGGPAGAGAGAGAAEGWPGGTGLSWTVSLATCRPCRSARALTSVSRARSQMNVLVHSGTMGSAVRAQRTVVRTVAKVESPRTRTLYVARSGARTLPFRVPQLA